MSLAQRHCVAPLLYHRLKTASLQEHVSQEIFQTLHRAYLRNAARNMRLYHELAQTLTLLREQNIPVIILKGAYLAEIVYGNIALRTMGDIDVLVPKTKLARSQQILLEAGYLDKNGRILVDMHWNIDLSSANLPIDINNIWKNAKPGILAGIEVYTLSAEDLLLHLCTHLAFHHAYQGAGLRALCDLQATIMYYSDAIHWQYLIQKTQQWKIRNAVYLTLALAQEMLNVQIPDSVLKTLKPVQMDPHIYSWSKYHILQGVADSPLISPFFWKIWISGSLREKCSAVYRLLFPPKEFMWQKYPAASQGTLQKMMYYIMRIRGHFFIYSSILWKILSGDRQVRLRIQQQQKLHKIRQWLISK